MTDIRAWGEKTVLILGSATYALFCLACYLTTSYGLLLAAAAVWGWGGAANWGTADIKPAKLSIAWSVPTGSIAKKSGSGSWTGLTPFESLLHRHIVVTCRAGEGHERFFQGERRILCAIVRAICRWSFWVVS